jgi:YVTN family beta-propeller protein
VTPIHSATNTAGPAIAVGTSPSGVAISPDGATVYVTNYFSRSVTRIDTTTNTAGRAIAVGSTPVEVAFTPHGKTAYVTNRGSGSVTPINTATNTASRAIATGGSPSGIAVTPDQPPLAAFSATTVGVGQPSEFDDSASSDADGTVVSYHWNFGDGSRRTTASATTAHTYAKAGTYTVTLRVTDNTGCSTRRVSTGQTVSRNVSPVARHFPPASVSTATPTISTEQRPARAAVGSSIADRATVSGGFNPTGTVTFRLYDNPTGAGAPLVLDTEPLIHGAATSRGHAVTAAGIVHWVATYNGDTNNHPVTSGAHEEPVSISAAAPRISTQRQPATAVVGSAIADRTTVSGGFRPTGTVTFSLYDNPIATGAPLFTDTEPLDNGTATSKRYIATATGTDYWVATYHGDANNLPVSSGTGEEPVTVHAVRFATRVRIATLRPAPLGPGCVVETGRDPREISVAGADAICRTLRLTLGGTIKTKGRPAASATGTIRARYRVRLPRAPAASGARARVNRGRWRISLVLPGVNLDPVPPLYRITARYSGDPTHRQANATRCIRLESERAGL